MTIPVKCECDHITRVRAELAGKQLICPACGQKCPVPWPEAERSRPATAGTSLCLRCRAPVPDDANVCPECGQNAASHAPPRRVMRPEREIGMTCLAVSVSLLGLWALAILEGPHPSAAIWIVLLAMVVSPIVSLGTRTRFDIVHDASGPRLRAQFSLAGIPMTARETPLAPIRTVLVAYEEYHVTSRSWILALALVPLGILPGLFYARFLAGQRPQGDDAMQGPYEMHHLSFVDHDGNVLDTLELRREKQVRQMLRLIASIVDVDIERV